MKKMYILALAALAMAFSCQKTENSPEPASEPVVRTFTCTFAQPDTKLAIDDDNGKTTWEVGDKIMIHGGTDGAARQLVTLAAGDISADGKSATISVTIDPYDRSDASVKSKYYAQYPGNLVPTGNMYYECCFNATNDKLMAACDVDGAFVFYNLCGIISYKVSGDFDQVVFSGNNNETVGYSDYYQVRVRNNNSGMEVNYHKPGNGFSTNTAAKSITAAVVADGTTVNTICIPNPAGFSGGFTMKFMKGGALVKTLSTTSNVALTHGQYRPMGDVTAYLKTYVPPTKHDNEIGVVVATATDLGSSATANCYVVSSAGDYMFKAVKGNSSTVVGTVASVAILWETWNTAETVTANSVIAAADYDLQSGEDPYIVFKTPATLKPGNALVAAKDEGGNILWSWHIWVPATPFTADTFGISSVKVMSRNLGALVDTVIPAEGTVDIRSVGLYYQWGRKDPFVGYKWDNPDIEVNVSGSSGRNMSKANAAITLATSIANPTTFVAFKGDWLSAHDNTLWGKGAAKTIYDPCPAGYRVPAYNTGDPMWQKVVDIPGFEANAAARAWKLGTAVFTMAGFYDYDGGMSHAYDRTFYWNNANNSNEDYGETQYVYYDSGTWKSEPGWGKRKACAAPIRCVAE